MRPAFRLEWISGICRKKYVIVKFTAVEIRRGEKNVLVKNIDLTQIGKKTRFNFKKLHVGMGTFGLEAA